MTRMERNARPTTKKRRRGRGFQPDYVSFSGTYQCNLSCPHCCVPIEWTDRLDIDTALRFLDSAHDVGIETLAFTGGEPFLYPEFVLALTERGAKHGMRFDKIMSNGVWFKDEADLTHVLTGLRDAGFSGKLGLSVDKFHGIHTAQLATYCRVARRVFARDTILALNYASVAPQKGLEPIQKLAKELNAVLDWSDLLHRYILVADDFTMTLNWNHLANVERAEKLPGEPWDGTWFAEDYCEGPGQALIVNPKGEVKPCCGFASDLDQLTIGNIYEHSAKEVIARGKAHPYVGAVFREGLTSIRERILAHDPNALPGETSNHCYFCWYVLAKGTYDAACTNPNDRVGSGGQWEKLALPVLGAAPASPCQKH